MYLYFFLDKTSIQYLSYIFISSFLIQISGLIMRKDLISMSYLKQILNIEILMSMILISLMYILVYIQRKLLILFYTLNTFLNWICYKITSVKYGL